MNLKARIKKTLHTIIMILKTEKKVPIPTQVNTSMLLDGKTALITGGSGGIGIAIVESFLKNGAFVILAGTSNEKLNLAVERLAKANTMYSERVKSIVIDVLDISSLAEKIKMASSLFEGRTIDILVNSAGVLNQSDFWNMTEQEYDHIMDINVKGTFFMCQETSHNNTIF